MAIAANTLHTATVFENQDRAVVTGTLLVSGAFAGLSANVLVNAVALKGSTMTLTSSDTNTSHFAVGTQLNGNTSNAYGTVSAIANNAGTYTITVDMANGQFTTTEVVDSNTHFSTLSNSAVRSVVAIEEIEWAVSSGAASLAYANSSPIAAVGTGSSKTRHMFTNRSGDPDPNVFISTHGVASNGTVFVAVTVKKVSGFTSTY